MLLSGHYLSQLIDDDVMTWGCVTLTELFKLTWASTIQNNQPIRRVGAPIGSRRSVRCQHNGAG